MADDPNQEQPAPQQPPEMNVSGVSDASPDQPPPPATATAKPEKKPETKPALNSQFMAPPDDPVKKVQDYLQLPKIDVHLQEMLKSAKIRDVDNKKIQGIDINYGAGSVFAGSIHGKSVISTDRGKLDEKGAKVMISLAKSKGWNTVYCTMGTSQKEKELLWIEAQRQGLEVGNFKPKRDSEIVRQWAEEQKHQQASGISEAAPEDDPHMKTMELLQSKVQAAEDPEVKSGLQKMLNVYKEGDMLGDTKTYAALSDALSDKNSPREGFNMAVDILNKADPGANFAKLEDAPARTAATASPRFSQPRQGI